MSPAPFFFNGPLKAPQHLDGVDKPHIDVVEVIKAAESEGGQGPDETLAYIWDRSVTTEEAGTDVINDNSLDTCKYKRYLS